MSKQLGAILPDHHDEKGDATTSVTSGQGPMT